jgi:hypothetical protein
MKFRFDSIYEPRVFFKKFIERFSYTVYPMQINNNPVLMYCLDIKPNETVIQAEMYGIPFFTKKVATYD